MMSYLVSRKIEYLVEEHENDEHTKPVYAVWHTNMCDPKKKKSKKQKQ